MHCLDTNIVVYAFAPGDKAVRASNLLEGATISVQVLNEYANVAFRKLRYETEELDSDIHLIRSLVSRVVSIEVTTHDLGRAVAARYKLSFYDSLHVAAALLADCDILYSEDMHHGLVIEDRLTILNPFI